jgi:photosystem II stability/assembly factor-like uncharacterized protein
MRTYIAFLCVALAGAGCKKSTGTGGGGGGWFTTSTGQIVHVDPAGHAGNGVELGESLNSIACRYLGEAWVVGAHGTLLYTNDGGTTWSGQAVPTQADLHSLATQDAGPVYLAGDGVFLRSGDAGASWQAFGDGQTGFRSIAAAQQGDTVLAIASDGGLWSFDAAAGVLARHATLDGAHAVAISPDGDTAFVAGNGLWRSLDAGVTWTQLSSDGSAVFDDVRVAEDGSAVAVGTAGAIANIDPSGAIRVKHLGSANLHTLHIADPDATDAIGYAGGDGGTVWITRDSGVTWSLGPSLSGTVLGVDEIGFGHR